MLDRTLALKTKLRELSVERRAAHSEAMQIALDTWVAHLKTVDMTAGALAVGSKLPSFLLPNAEGKLVSSDDLLRKGPLAVSFYRGDWCPFCVLALQSLAEAFSEIRDIGGSVVAITPDLISVTETTVADLALPFDVLSDVDSAFGLQCGVIYRVPDPLMEHFAFLGLPQRHGGDAFFLPVPAAFVADTTGTIRYAYVDPDYEKPPDGWALIESLRALGAD